MKKWFGAAGICVNEEKQILMVKQGKPDEKKLWTVPSGGKEDDETYEACCIREINEETGYDAGVVKPLFIKEGTNLVSLWKCIILRYMYMRVNPRYRILII